MNDQDRALAVLCVLLLFIFFCATMSMMSR